WVAVWGSVPPTRHWNFWQYQGVGIDRDRFNGTLADLHALAGIAGGGMPINTSGYYVTSGKVAVVHAITPILDETGSTVGKTVIGSRLVAIGIQSGKIACLFSSGKPWPDHVARPPVLFVAVG